MTSSENTVRSISLDKVKITDKFWAPRIRLNHEITLPFVLKDVRKQDK